MKRILLLLSSGAMMGLSAMAQTFSGGDGSAETPYLITKAADLDELAQLVTDGNDMAGMTLRLEADLTVSSNPMIGHTGANQPKKFAGTFDGNGHRITGLKFNSDKKHIGLFASLGSAGVVKDLTLTQPSLTTSNSYAGFIAAASEGLIENCHVVNGVFESLDGSYKGGLVGENKGLVKGCTVSGSITSTSNAGGVIGQNYGQVEGCGSSVNIVSLAPNQNNVQFGGITGVTIKLNSSPHIHDCYFTGAISGSLANNCGGITGTLSGCEMLRCWNSGYISSTGISGALTNSFEKGAKIKDCYNVGTVYNVYSTSVGGLVGQVSTDNSELVIENSLNMGPVFTAMTARHEGVELVGANHTRATIVNSWYDSQITGVCSQSNGLTTAQLTSAAGIEGFDNTVWVFSEGMYPRLANTADTEAAILGATPIFLADGDRAIKVTSDFSVSSANDVEWEMNRNSAATMSGNQISVTRGDKKVDIQLHAYLGNSEKRLLVSVYPVIFQGEGTAGSPYLISDANDLMKLSDATNAQGLDFTGEHFLMTADIDMAGTSFVPMAFNSAELAFNGVFDGGNHKIKNLALDSRTNSVMNVGLFRTVYSDGVVKNLTIDGSCSFDIFRNFAPFVAVLYGTVENCRNYADIPTTTGFSGGIAYVAYGDSRIIDCYNEGRLSATGNGGAMAGIVYHNEGLVENCQNNGDVAGGPSGSKTVGGIVCLNKGTVKNVINTGRLSAGSEVAGIVTDSKAGGVVSNALSIGQIEILSSRDNSGAAIGKDAGGTFENVYYDSQIVMSGTPFDGVTALPTASLTVATLPVAGMEGKWLATDGRYPRLAMFADEEASRLASMPVWFADGMECEQLAADATLAVAEGLVWSLRDGVAFSISGDKLLVTNTDTYVKDELTATLDGGRSRSLSIAALADIFNGDGTAESPYLIESAADLDKLSADMAASGQDYAGKHFLMTADIDMDGAQFTPIAGNGLVEFNGIFDGGSRMIDNIYVEETVDGVGLFGRVGASGVVKNLAIGGGSSISGKGSVGALVGILAGTLQNCVNNGEVLSSASTSNLGGLVGQATGSALVQECVNNSGITGKSQTGGVVGYANGAEIRIVDVRNNGAVTGTTKTGGVVGNMVNTVIDGGVNAGKVTGTTDVGGVAGYASKESAITGSRNLGEVNGGTEIAGILGYAYTNMTVSDSYNAGNVTATSSTAGGIIGRGSQPVVERSFNLGNVSNTKSSLGSTTAGAGGIVGRGDPFVTDAYNMGTVTAEKNAGGIVGSYDLSSKTTTLTRVYQAGRVVSTIEAPANIGVFVGRGNKTSFDAVYYDRQVIHNLEAEDGALLTSELAATDFGEGWSRRDDMLPMLSGFVDDDYARLYASTVFLDSDDHMGQVSKAFRVSDGVEWSGDSGAFSFDGDNVTPVAGAIGEYVLTAKLGDLSREVPLVLTGTSSVMAVDGTATPGVRAVAGGLLFGSECDYTVYDMAGVALRSGSAVAGEIIALAPGVYIVKTAGVIHKTVVR